MQHAAPIELTDLVDLQAFPIHDPASAAYVAAADAARAGLRSEGCAVLGGFVRPEAVARLNDEILERKHATHYSTQVMNPYFHTAVNPDYPPDHPVNTFIERSSGFIPGDAWDSGCAIDMLFRAPEVARFIADCLEIGALHCYDDPLAGLTANICDPGQQFTWHFDTNDFAVTVLVQPGDEGGLFEYVPQIRSADDEGFEAIAGVLAGGRQGVRTLDLRPGDLQIFRGRYSLHRVTRVGAGSRPRHAAIFAYTLEPGVIGRVERTRQLFGRVLPAHEEAERQRVRSDALLD
ncbi:MAG: hypothetical protein OXH54_02630 [Acidimicrobiaceae bacterium]|nr:hypothetical protein [Acidimicrobiaceae bacterium]